MLYYLCIFLALVSIAHSKAQLGVYTSAAPYGPPLVNEYSAWLNNPVVYALEFEAVETWDHLSGQSWWLGPWSTWVNSAPSGQTRYLVISIGMIPNTPSSANIGDGAKGLYNGYFKTLAQQLVQYKLESAVLRIGWEFNGDWYRWTAKPSCTEWSQYYAQIVNTMKAVPGNKFTTVWNVNNGYAAVDATQCWPGDQYVDYVGVDAYDVDWNNYNWPITRAFGQWNSTIQYMAGDAVEYKVAVWKSDKNNVGVTPGTNNGTWTLLADTATLQDKRVKAWNDNCNGGFGLNFWANFAKSKGKPITLNEWGVWAQTHGGFDDDYYIEKMYEWIQANNVAFYSYFDVYAGDGDHKLMPPTQFPLASKKFHDLFGK